MEKVPLVVVGLATPELAEHFSDDNFEIKHVNTSQMEPVPQKCFISTGIPERSRLGQGDTQK